MIFSTSDNNYIPPIRIKRLANDRFGERVPAFNINDKQLGPASCLYQFKALKELGVPIFERRMKLFVPHNMETSLVTMKLKRLQIFPSEPPWHASI